MAPGGHPRPPGRAPPAAGGGHGRRGRARGGAPAVPGRRGRRRREPRARPHGLRVRRDRAAGLRGRRRRPHRGRAPGGAGVRGRGAAGGRGRRRRRPDRDDRQPAGLDLVGIHRLRRLRRQRRRPAAGWWCSRWRSWSPSVLALAVARAGDRRAALYFGTCAAARRRGVPHLLHRGGLRVLGLPDGDRAQPDPDGTAHRPHLHRHRRGVRRPWAPPRSPRSALAQPRPRAPTRGISQASSSWRARCSSPRVGDGLAVGERRGVGQGRLDLGDARPRRARSRPPAGGPPAGRPCATGGARARRRRARRSRPRGAERAGGGVGGGAWASARARRKSA